MITNIDILIEISKFIPLNEYHNIMVLSKYINKMINRNLTIWRYKFHQLIKELNISKNIEVNNYKKLCKKYKSLARINKWSKNIYAIDQLTNLQYLYLYRNQITVIPREISQFKQFTMSKFT